MTEPQWLSLDQVLRLHDIQIHRYGGQPGVRDYGLLESAVLRPRNTHWYEDPEHIADLAATYAISINANHPFIDGNKRTAFYAMTVFLELNGARLHAPQDDATNAMLALAAGTWTHGEFRDWVQRWVKVVESA